MRVCILAGERTVLESMIETDEIPFYKLSLVI